LQDRLGGIAISTTPAPRGWTTRVWLSKTMALFSRKAIGLPTTTTATAQLN